MKIFVSTQNDAPGKQLYDQLYDILSQSGAIVYNQHSQLPNDISFDKLDAVVVVAEDQNEHTGYLLALAIAQKKPSLYLIAKGKPVPAELHYIKDNKKISKYVIVKHYSSENIQHKVSQFIQQLENGNQHWDEPNIKFTWRITPRIARYLKWKSIHTKKSKADWLRDYLVHNAIQQDEDYQQFLKYDQ